MKKRKMALWVLAPILLLILLIGILISPLGSPLLGPLASAIVPNLEIEEVSGSPLSTFTVEGVSWKNEQWLVAHTLPSNNSEVGFGLRSFHKVRISI